VNQDVDVIIGKFVDDVFHPTVAQIRHVFLEGQAEQSDTGAFDQASCVDHGFLWLFPR